MKCPRWLSINRPGNVAVISASVKSIAKRLIASTIIRDAVQISNGRSRLLRNSTFPLAITVLAELYGDGERLLEESSRVVLSPTSGSIAEQSQHFLCTKCVDVLPVVGSILNKNKYDAERKGQLTIGAI
jgi:hypothetical protein